MAATARPMRTRPAQTPPARVPAPDGGLPAVTLEEIRSLWAATLSSAQDPGATLKGAGAADSHSSLEVRQVRIVGPDGPPQPPPQYKLRGVPAGVFQSEPQVSPVLVVKEDILAAVAALRDRVRHASHEPAEGPGTKVRLIPGNPRRETRILFPNIRGNPVRGPESGDRVYASRALYSISSPEGHPRVSS